MSRINGGNVENSADAVNHQPKTSESDDLRPTINFSSALIQLNRFVFMRPKQPEYLTVH